MKRIGRFEADERDARATAMLASSAWVPRSRREALATRLVARLPPPLRRAGITQLGAPAPSDAGAPSHEDAVAAARSVLGAGISGPLSLLPAPTSASPRRLLWLWRDGEAEPFAIAKVAPAHLAEPLRAEARALGEVAALRVPGLAGLLPGVLACAAAGTLFVLACSALPGQPLARRHRMSPALSWDEHACAAAGRALGALHAATYADGRSLLHGDAWSRNVLVEGDRVSGLVDWEASRRGEPAREIARFLAASALADTAGRATLPPPRLAEWPLGARAFVEAWRAQQPASVAPLTDALLAAEIDALGAPGSPA